MFIYVTIFYNEKEGKMDDEVLWKPDVFEFLPFTILSRVQPLPIPTVDRLRTRSPATLGQNLNNSFKLRKTFDFFLICKVVLAKSGSMKIQIQKLSFVHDDKFQNVKPMAAAVERFEFKANTWRANPRWLLTHIFPPHIYSVEIKSQQIFTHSNLAVVPKTY